MNIILFAGDKLLIKNIHSEFASSILTSINIIDVFSLEKVKLIPDKSNVDVLLMEVNKENLENGQLFKSIQGYFPGKPIIALIDYEDLDRYIQKANKYAYGFAIKSGLDVRVLDAVILQAVDRMDTRLQLQESSRQMKNLMDNLPGIAYRCMNDKDWTMEFISAGCFELTGYDASDLQYNKKLSFNDLIHPEDQIMVWDEVQHALLENRQFQMEYRIHTADNQEKWVWERGALIGDLSGTQKLEGFITDITSKRQRELNMLGLIEIGNVIRKHLTQPDLGDRILKTISSLFNLDCAAISTFSNQNSQLFMRFTHGRWKDFQKKELPILGSKFKEIIKKDLPTIIDAQIETGLLDELYKKDKCRYHAIIPLKTEEKNLGLLILGRKNKFSENQFAVFTALGDQITFAFERQTLFQKLEKQLEQLSSLHSIDQAITGVYDLKVINQIILEEVRKILGADAANILHLNSLTHTLDMLGNVGFHRSSVRTVKAPVTTCTAGKVLMDRSVFQAPDLSTRPIEFMVKEWAEEGYKAYFAHPLIVRGKPVGVMELYFMDVFYPDNDWLEFFGSLAAQAAIAYDSCHTFSDLQNIKQNLTNTYNATLETWSKSLELNNIESQGHIQRVTTQTLKLAKEIGVKESDLPNIERGALLHDIGKLGILDEILLKKGELTDTEWCEIEKHPVIARDLLSGVNLLKEATEIPYSHHENWDGSGYPQGLKEEAIPLAARIFAVVETYDALMSDKPYRKAWPQESIIEYLENEKGKKFDPEIIDKFISSLQLIGK